MVMEMQKVVNFLENELCLKENDVIVLGNSYGPDSMALLNVLLNIRKKINIKIIIAHVNHNLRKESAKEKIDLESFCLDNNLIFESMIIEQYGDDNFHNEARKIRYHFFEEIVEKYHSKYLMTAHHGDDLVETVLMRIVRGSTLKGYAGFEKAIDKGTYILVRPLVFATKDEIEKYNIKNKILQWIVKVREKL